MANSKYEYVRSFEQLDRLLPNTWIVVRIDGRGFHKFASRYSFERPNDARALHLMNDCAIATLRSISDLVFAYGLSDEYSFVFEKSTELFERRASKLVCTIVSTFTANYVFSFKKHLGLDLDGGMLPTFDGRAVCFPSWGNLRDYLSWRQVDCHINNLYNTTFWAMVQKGGMDNKDAEQELKGTVSSDKNEILFSRFGINYNNEPELYRKGSVVYCNNYTENENVTGPDQHSVILMGALDSASTALPTPPPSKTQAEKARKRKSTSKIVVEHVDIIKDEFWAKRPWIWDGR